MRMASAIAVCALCIVLSFAIIIDAAQLIV
jgi:hypothetical protein